MKRKSIALVLVVLLIALFSCNISKAFSVKIDDVKAKKGEEFTVNFNMEKKSTIANGHIKFDSSKLEFVRADQKNMNSNLVSDGDLAWIYFDMNREGTDKFEFTFRLKEDGKSELKFDDLAIVDIDGGENDMNAITGNTTITVQSKSNSVVIWAVIAGVVIIAGVVVVKCKK